jgi:hypothetical protein
MLLKNLLKSLVGIVLGGFLLLVGAGFVLPSQVHVERSILIDAEPQVIFPLIIAVCRLVKYSSNNG